MTLAHPLPAEVVGLLAGLVLMLVGKLWSWSP